MRLLRGLLQGRFESAGWREGVQYNDVDNRMGLCLGHIPYSFPIAEARKQGTPNLRPESRDALAIQVVIHGWKYSRYTSIPLWYPKPETLNHKSVY